MPDPRSKAAQPVTFDTSSLEVWGLAGSGYSVKLIGEIDYVWAGVFGQAQQAPGHRAEFHLDHARGVMAFSLRAEDDPQRILSELRALLDLTNRRAGRQTAIEPFNAGPLAAEEPPGSVECKS
jgi:hypothetical protein